MRAHTFLSFTLQQLLLFAATIYFICCNYFLFAATTFYLQKLYLICSNFILFAATFLFAACPLWATVQISRGTQRRFPPERIENTFLVIQSPFRSLEKHSKRRCKICFSAVFLGEIESFSKLQGLENYFPENF